MMPPEEMAGLGVQSLLRVQVLVGCLESCVCTVRDQGAPRGERHGERPPLAPGDLQALEQELLPVGTGLFEDHQELVPTQPDGVFGDANLVTQDGPEAAQHLIASEMAVLVIHLLELVEVEQNHHVTHTQTPGGRW